MSKLSQIQRQDIINALADGVSSGVLARQYDVHRSSIKAIKATNIATIEKRLTKAIDLKEQSYFLALHEIKSRLDNPKDISTKDLVMLFKELNTQMKESPERPENEVKYKQLTANEIEQKIKGLLAEFKHIKKLDTVVEVSTT